MEVSMITVKFFGLLNVDNNIKHLTIDDGKFKDVIEEIITKCPTITKKQLLSSVVFINKKQVASKKSLSITLKNGDEIAFISPSSGG